LKESFPDQLLTPTPRSLVINQNIEDPNWLAGFTAGEGSFYVQFLSLKPN